MGRSDLPVPVARVVTVVLSNGKVLQQKVTQSSKNWGNAGLEAKSPKQCNVPLINSLSFLDANGSKCTTALHKSSCTTAHQRIM